MKYVVQKSRGLWEDQYIYEFGNIRALTKHLGKAKVFDTKEEALTFEAYPDTLSCKVTEVSEKELFKAKLAMT